MISRSTLLKLQFVGPLLILAISFLTLGYAAHRVHQQHDLVEEMNQKLMLMRLNYEFKVQVQEWKNFLIRTNSQETLVKNWSKFLVQEEKTRQVIKDLVTLGGEVNLTQAAEQFHQEHKILGEQYRAGYQVFKDANFDHEQADLSVRKIDRPLSEWLSNLVGEIQWRALHQSNNNMATLFSVLAVSCSFALLFGGAVAFAPYYKLRRVIREEVDRTAELAYMATTDLVTNLYNRTHFKSIVDEQCKNSPANAERVVMFVDLDGLNHINEIFGHAQGDKVLIEASARIRDTVDDFSLAARFGGSAFLISRPVDKTQIEINEFADKLLEELTHPYYFSGSPHYLSVNIGVAYYPQHGRDAESLIRNADLAMYQGKRRHQNSVNSYDENLSRSASLFAARRKELGEALELSQLVLFAQPIVDIRTGAINTVEILVRWKHPTRGIVSPGEFIQLAEECGMIGKLGSWVLENTLAHFASLPTNIGVAINVSPYQLSEPGFHEQVAYLIKKHNIEPSRLELELTESVFLPEFVEKLEQLKALGVKISIDDFGTGYSNLKFLSSKHIDKIKLDMSFVRDIHKHEQNQNIVSSICGLAEGMGLEVVCEGVETMKELEYLRNTIRCHLVQGYIFNAPKPFESLIDEVNEQGVDLYKISA